jgi:diacylglycerol kinase family enzyme
MNPVSREVTAESFGAVFVLGGDGTANEVVNGGNSVA